MSSVVWPVLHIIVIVNVFHFVIVIDIKRVTKSIDPGLSVQKLLELLLDVINQGVPTPDYIWG